MQCKLGFSRARQMSTFRYRILFVDNEETIRETGSAALQAQGYEVLTAEDGLDAVQCLSGALPELIISDLRMPKMSGFEFLALVRKRFPQIPTIATSGEYLSDNIPGGLLADAFFKKGEYPLEGYFEKIKELLAKPPARDFPGTRTSSPIWVALYGTGEIVITCPQCLRSTEVDAAQVGFGVHKAQCEHCQNSFEYNVDEHNVGPMSAAHLARR